MTAAREVAAWLSDILEASTKARQFLGSMTLAEFNADEKTAYAVIRALEVLGEAARRIPSSMRDQNPHVPWRAMAGIRDKLIHDYVTVNLEWFGRLSKKTCRRWSLTFNKFFAT